MALLQIKIDDDLKARASLLFKELGIECFEAKGAFYLFPSIKKFNLSSREICLKLLHEHNVLVVPGTAFGDSGEGFIRISYAYSIENLKEAISRLSNFVRRLESK